MDFIDSNAGWGGVIDSGNDSNTTFTECRFIRPTAIEGAVYYAYGQAGTRFVDCYSEDSYASMNGGVFFFSSQTSPVIDGWYGVNATAVGDGAIMRHTTGVHATIRNSVFEGSRSGRQSALFSNGGRGLTVENTVIRDSVATLGDGSMLNFGDRVENVTLENVEGRTSALKLQYLGQDQADATVVRGSVRGLTIIGGRGLTRGLIEVQNDYPGCASLEDLTVRDSTGYTGGILVDDDACVDVDGLEMTDSSATFAGSLIYTTSSSLPSSIRNAVVHRSRAASPSGISLTGCAGTGLPSGGIYLNNAVPPAGASAAAASSCPSWITSAIALENVTMTDSYAEGAGALVYVDAAAGPARIEGCDLGSFCAAPADCTATGAVAGSYGSGIAGPPRTLALAGDAAAVGAGAGGAYEMAVVPSRPIQLSFTLDDAFGSRIRGGLPAGSDVVVLRSNLTDPARVASGAVCYPDCAPYSSEGSGIEVFDLVIDALPGSSVPVRFSTSPATTEVDMVFRMDACGADREWSSVHRQCVLVRCPPGQYVSLATPSSVPACASCPANCSERRFWTFTVAGTCEAAEVSRSVLFSYEPIALRPGSCRTTSPAPGDTPDLLASCGPGGDLPAAFSVDCDYQTHSGPWIAVAVAAGACLLLALLVLAALLRPAGGRHSTMFSRAYCVCSCGGIAAAALPVFTVFDGERLTDGRCALKFVWPVVAFLLVSLPMWTKMCYVHRVLVNRNLKSIKHSTALANAAALAAGVGVLGVLFMTMDHLRAEVVLDFDNPAGVPVGSTQCVSDNDNQALVILLYLAALGTALHGCQMVLKLRKLVASVPDIFTVGLAYFWMTATGVVFAVVYLLESKDAFGTEEDFLVYTVGLMLTFVVAAAVDCSMPLLKSFGVDVEKFIIKVAPLVTDAQSSAGGSTGAATTSFESAAFKSDASMSAAQQEEQFKLMQQIATENQVLKLQVVKLTQQLKEYTDGQTKE